MDSLFTLFTETRRQRPPVYLADEWAHWKESIAQCITAFPTPERRWACAVLVADDICKAMPGLSLDLAFGYVEEAVRRAAGETTIHSQDKGERSW